MLYKKNFSTALDDNLFKNPTSEYRGTPFWAWNNLLTKDELCRQIDIFKKMGLGGFHMHVRTGLKNEYLSENYMGLVKACVNKAKNENMLSWLYDEDRWPSGAGGGFVTREEKYRARSLVLTVDKNGGTLDSKKELSRAEATRTGQGKVLACYDVVLDKNGYLKSYKKIKETDSCEGTKWYAVLEICEPNSWYNDSAYADTLNKEAIKKFIEVTHEKYKKEVGYEFGKTIPAIFTDEPQFTRKQTFKNSFDKSDVAMPWTDAVPEHYKKAYNADIFDTLPEIFWDLEGSSPSIHRYRYHDLIAELFASSFADTVGSWCKENSIALTGHMMEEPTLQSQTAALGEAMRSYRSFQLPGIDMLCNAHEFTTAKQAQSAAHQFGKEGVLSELYGVTGWDCDFKTYKHQGDWQAALGITVRVPHLSWYAMEGEAKRDYPASISYQSPWYKKYHLIEDHFARVNTALTRGKPIVKIGVIHPVESFWLHWGPNDKSAIFKEGLDEKFQALTTWLLEGSIDFDFICESLLPSLQKKSSSPLKIGEMEYSAILVPGCETLRSSTIKSLENFKKAGGKVIFLGECPSLCDAVESNRCASLYASSPKIDFTRAAVLTCLDKDRTLTIRKSDGTLTDNLLYQLREDNDCNWLFIAHSKEPYNADIDTGENIKIIIQGEYGVITYDTQNGETYPADFYVENGKTIISEHIYSYDSKLYKLTKSQNIKPLKPSSDSKNLEQNKLYEGVEFSLSEENVLLLDMAEYKLEGEEHFCEKEEILRLDNICREKLKLKARGGEVVQPWVYGEKEPISQVTLKYNFTSEIDYDGAFLALETPEKAKINFNNVDVPNNTAGNFVDISIFKIPLPKIKTGKNTLIVTYPFGESSNLESMYILGDFGVKIKGTEKIICPMPKKIYFHDITTQGLPFYSGNITYKIPFSTNKSVLEIQATQFRGSLISVNIDGEEKGEIIYPPYYLKVKNIAPGEHFVNLTLYLNRYNTFGPLHLVDEKEKWQDPYAWRSSANNWSYEYNFKKLGILKSPVII